jgi:hypothetical protein
MQLKTSETFGYLFIWSNEIISLRVSSFEVSTLAAGLGETVVAVVQGADWGRFRGSWLLVLDDVDSGVLMLWWVLLVVFDVSQLVS